MSKAPSEPPSDPKPLPPQNDPTPPPLTPSAPPAESRQVPEVGTPVPPPSQSPGTSARTSGSGGSSQAPSRIPRPVQNSSPAPTQSHSDLGSQRSEGGGGKGRPSDDYRPGASRSSQVQQDQLANHAPDAQGQNASGQSQTPSTSGQPGTRIPRPKVAVLQKGVGSEAGESHDPSPTPSAMPTSQLGSMFSRLRKRVETATGLQQAPPTEDQGSKVSQGIGEGLHEKLVWGGIILMQLYIVLNCYDNE